MSHRCLCSSRTAAKSSRIGAARLTLLAAVLLTLFGTLQATPAHAALIVSMQSTNVPSGGTGTVNLFVRSDDGTDVIDIFTIELTIIDPGIEFINPPLDTYLYSPSYLLYGDSAAASLGPPAGLVTSVSAPNDTYLGGDGTLSGLGVTVPTTDTLFLSAVVTSRTSSPPSPGDTFRLVALVDFFPPGDDPEPSRSKTAGTIDVTKPEPTSVPEPGSWLTLGGLALASFTLGRIARGKKQG